MSVMYLIHCAVSNITIMLGQAILLLYSQYLFRAMVNRGRESVGSLFLAYPSSAQRKYIKDNQRNFIVTTVPADVLATLGAWAS